jgi:hypothetical protein
MAKNDKYEKERQRRNFFNEANEEYGFTEKSYDDLSEEDKVKVVRQLRQIRNTVSLDRSKFEKWKKYMLSNPVYFKDIFGKECTITNINYEYNMIKVRGYTSADFEPEKSSRINSEGCYWRSGKKT